MTRQGGDLRGRLDAALEPIQGWLDLEEAWALHEAVRAAGTPGHEALVVEIGSWKGRSTVALALGLRAAGGRGRVYAVDPHAGADFRFRELLHNLDRAGVQDLVEPVRLASLDARPGFDGRRIDVLFVDGSHDYEDVAADLDAWVPLVAPGGVVAVNDPFWPGVNRALRERATRARSPLRRPRLVLNTLLFRRRSGSEGGRERRERLGLRAALAIGRRTHAPPGSEAHGGSGRLARAAPTILRFLVRGRAAPPPEPVRPGTTRILRALREADVAVVRSLLADDLTVTLRSGAGDRFATGAEAADLLERFTIVAFGPGAVDDLWMVRGSGDEVVAMVSTSRNDGTRIDVALALGWRGDRLARVGIISAGDPAGRVPADWTE